MRGCLICIRNTAGATPYSHTDMENMLAISYIHTGFYRGYILENSSSPGGGGTSADVIGGKNMKRRREKGGKYKRKRKKRGKKKEEMGSKRVK